MTSQIIKISKNDEFSKNSSKFEIEPSKKYGVIVSLKGNKGLEYCAYFVVVVLDENNLEISRYIRWINDFSGEKKDYSLKFTAPKKSKYAVIGIRCNIETPLKSDLEIEIPEKNDLKLIPVDISDDEIYDDINDFSLSAVNLSESKEKKFEEKLVWITCSVRSGSTWLTTQLLNHPENIIWDEPYVVNHFAMVRAWESRRSHLDFFSKAHKNIWAPLFKKLILNRTYSHTQTYKKNVIIKDPNVGGKGIEIILECLPKSKLIFLLRDGRDIVDSQIDAFKKGSWNEDGGEWLKNTTRERRIELLSKGWTKSIKSVFESFQKHNSKLKILVKYEDLLTNTLDELQKIYDFIGIKTSENELKEKIKKYEFKNIPNSMKGSGKFYRVATPGKWKENFNQEEQKLMNSIMGEILKKMNYEI